MIEISPQATSASPGMELPNVGIFTNVVIEGFCYKKISAWMAETRFVTWVCGLPALL